MDDFNAEMTHETSYTSKLTLLGYVTFVSTDIRSLGRIFTHQGIVICENVSGNFFTDR